MTIANLALLKEAFISEQERMQAWMDEMKKITPLRKTR